jgi:hypothetical protein
MKRRFVIKASSQEPSRLTKCKAHSTRTVVKGSTSSDTNFIKEMLSGAKHDPLAKYYDIISDAEFDSIYGSGMSSSTTVQNIPYYDFIHVAWAAAKSEYDEALSDNGLDVLEIAIELESHSPMWVYSVGRDVMSADVEEIEDIIEY